MNKLKFFIAFFFLFHIQHGICASPIRHLFNETEKNDTLNIEKEVKRFNKKANSVIKKMEIAAKEMSIEGVCMIAFIPTATSKKWVSYMKVVGKMKTKDANLLGIAYTKASEMADTFKNSGSGIRPILNGECGYEGGMVRPYKSGYLIAAFSGGSNAQDLAISKIALDELDKNADTGKL